MEACLVRRLKHRDMKEQHCIILKIQVFYIVSYDYRISFVFRIKQFLGLFVPEDECTYVSRRLWAVFTIRHSVTSEKTSYHCETLESRIVAFLNFFKKVTVNHY
jgi:hypothetical protein